MTAPPPAPHRLQIARDFREPRPPAPKRTRWAIGPRFDMALMGDRAEKSRQAGMGGAGGSLRFRPAPHFAVDFALDALTGTDFAGYERTEIAFAVNPTYFFNPKDRLQLYMFGGMGGASARVSGEDYAYRYFGVDGGIGIEWRESRALGFDIDLVGFVRSRVDDRSGRYPEFVDPSTGRVTNTSGGGLFRVGVMYYW